MNAIAACGHKSISVYPGSRVCMQAYCHRLSRADGLCHRVIDGPLDSEV